MDVSNTLPPQRSLADRSQKHRPDSIARSEGPSVAPVFQNKFPYEIHLRISQFLAPGNNSLMAEMSFRSAGLEAYRHTPQITRLSSGQAGGIASSVQLMKYCADVCTLLTTAHTSRSSSPQSPRREDSARLHAEVLIRLAPSNLFVGREHEVAPHRKAFLLAVKAMPLNLQPGPLMAYIDHILAVIPRDVEPDRGISDAQFGQLFTTAEEMVMRFAQPEKQRLAAHLVRAAGLHGQWVLRVDLRKLLDTLSCAGAATQHVVSTVAGAIAGMPMNHLTVLLDWIHRPDAPHRPALTARQQSTLRLAVASRLEQQAAVEPDEDELDDAAELLADAIGKLLEAAAASPYAAAECAALCGVAIAARPWCGVFFEDETRLLETGFQVLERLLPKIDVPDPQGSALRRLVSHLSGLVRVPTELESSPVLETARTLSRAISIFVVDKLAGQRADYLAMDRGTRVAQVQAWIEGGLEYALSEHAPDQQPSDFEDLADDVKLEIEEEISELLETDRSEAALKAQVAMATSERVHDQIVYGWAMDQTADRQSRLIELLTSAPDSAAVAAIQSAVLGVRISADIVDWADELWRLAGQRLQPNQTLEVFSILAQNLSIENGATELGQYLVLTALRQPADRQADYWDTLVRVMRPAETPLAQFFEALDQERVRKKAMPALVEGLDRQFGQWTKDLPSNRIVEQINAVPLHEMDDEPAEARARVSNAVMNMLESVPGGDWDTWRAMDETCGFMSASEHLARLPRMLQCLAGISAPRSVDEVRAVAAQAIDGLDVGLRLPDATMATYHQVVGHTAEQIRPSAWNLAYGAARHLPGFAFDKAAGVRPAAEAIAHVLASAPKHAGATTSQRNALETGLNGYQRDRDLLREFRSILTNEEEKMHEAGLLGPFFEAAILSIKHMPGLGSLLPYYVNLICHRLREAESLSPATLRSLARVLLDEVVTSRMGKPAPNEDTLPSFEKMYGALTVIVPREMMATIPTLAHDERELAVTGMPYGTLSSFSRARDAAEKRPLFHQLGFVAQGLRTMEDEAAGRVWKRWIQTALEFWPKEGSTESPAVEALVAMTRLAGPLARQSDGIGENMRSQMLLDILDARRNIKTADLQPRELEVNVIVAVALQVKLVAWSLPHRRALSQAVLEALGEGASSTHVRQVADALEGKTREQSDESFAGRLARRNTTAG